MYRERALKASTLINNKFVINAKVCSTHLPNRASSCTIFQSIPSHKNHPSPTYPTCHHLSEKLTRVHRVQFSKNVRRSYLRQRYTKRPSRAEIQGTGSRMAGRHAIVAYSAERNAVSCGARATLIEKEKERKKKKRRKKEGTERRGARGVDIDVYKIHRAIESSFSRAEGYLAYYLNHIYCPTRTQLRGRMPPPPRTTLHRKIIDRLWGGCKFPRACVRRRKYRLWQ